jgi:hypothetical protein
VGFEVYVQVCPENELWNVAQAARFLNVSECWVRRHQSELPSVRVGSRLRFDPQLIRQEFSCKTNAGSRVKQKGDASMFQAIKTRYQLGRVYKKGKKTVKWYGQFREDQLDAEGKLFRVQKNLCLGTLMELRTKHAAKQELARRMGTGTPLKANMLLRDLVSR